MISQEPKDSQEQIRMNMKSYDLGSNRTSTNGSGRLSRACSPMTPVRLVDAEVLRRNRPALRLSARLLLRLGHRFLYHFAGSCNTAVLKVSTSNTGPTLLS